MMKKNSDRDESGIGPHTYGIPGFPQDYWETERKHADEVARKFVAHTNRELEKVSVQSAMEVMPNLVSAVYKLDFSTLRSVTIEQILRHLIARELQKELLNKYAAHLDGYDEEVEKRVSQSKTELAKLGAKAKLARDPKQIAKAKAHELWLERYAGRHPRLRTNEQFATECMQRWPELTSSAVITGWCTKWNKDAKSENPQPAS